MHERSGSSHLIDSCKLTAKAKTGARTGVFISMHTPVLKLKLNRWHKQATAVEDTVDNSWRNRAVSGKSKIHQAFCMYSKCTTVTGINWINLTHQIYGNQIWSGQDNKVFWLAENRYSDSNVLYLRLMRQQKRLAAIQINYFLKCN